MSPSPYEEAQREIAALSAQKSDPTEADVLVLCVLVGRRLRSVDLTDPDWNGDEGHVRLTPVRPKLGFLAFSCCAVRTEHPSENRRRGLALYGRSRYSISQRVTT